MGPGGRTPGRGRAARAAAWPELVRTGGAVAGLFGALAGLAEALEVALVERRAGSFADLFGYAMLIDGLLFGLAGALAGLLAAAAGRGRVTPARLVAVLAPAAGLLAGAVAYWHGTGLFEADSAGAPPQVRAGRLAIAAAAVGLALACGALLAVGRGGAARALLFGRRVAPLGLLLALALAFGGIVRDLGARGLGPGELVGRSVPTAAPAQTVRPTGPPPVAASAGQADAAGGRPDPPAQSPNVLLVTIDTLRADHLGAAGYAAARTPTLDRLAAEGVLLANNWTNHTGTNPAHASIFTGTYPATHGVRSHMLDLLRPGVPTLAESFAARGYETAGLYSWVSLEPAYSGLERGFQTYTDLTVNLPAYLADRRTSTLAATYRRLKSLLALPGAVDRQLTMSQQVEESMDGKADLTTDGAILWLEGYRDRARADGRPFFLWVHYFDPHYPYTPPPPYDRVRSPCDGCPDGGWSTIRTIEAEEHPAFSPAQIDRLLDYYDGEIAFTDEQLGRLLGALRDLGLADDTLVAVLGDHGENFGERGRWLHGRSLYAPEARVPVVLHFPGHLPGGAVVGAVTRSIDLMPTILELFGLPIPPTVEGLSVLPLLDGRASGEERFAVAELHDRSMESVVTRDWQLVWHAGEGQIELFRNADDPRAQPDRLFQEPGRAAELLRLLERWDEAHP